MTIPEDVMTRAKEAHARFADSRVTDNLTDIIARAILTDREARSGWRDIASAPKLNVSILTFCNGHVGTSRYCEGFADVYGDTSPGWYSEQLDRRHNPTHWMPLPEPPSTSPSPSREETGGEKGKAAVTYSQEEYDEAYEIGKRDGYSDAVQDIDEKTGGDGEYRYCLGMEDDIRHQPDPATMIQRIVDRFETLNLLEDASKSGRDQEWGDKPSASALLLEAEKALEPFAKVGSLIDGPFGPALFTDNEQAFKSGCAWKEDGETKTLTWGNFRAARSTLSKIRGGE